MIETAAWQDANWRDLSTAIAWLRDRLERLGRQPAVDAFEPSAAEPSASPLTAGPVAHVDAQIDPTPSMGRLCDCFGLSRFEQNILLLCAAMELDTRIASLCARAQDDKNRPYPTFALAMCLFDEPAWDALSPTRPLRYWRLIEIAASPGQPTTMSPIGADERILHYLKGLDHLDTRLIPLMAPLAVPAERELPPTQRALVERIAGQLRHHGAPPPIVQLVGPDALSKEMVACSAAATFGRLMYRLEADALPTQTSELELLARLWQRESVLSPVALYVDAQEGDGAPEGTSPSALRRFLSRSEGLVVLATREFFPRLSRPGLSIDVDKPAALEQEAAWRDTLGANAGESPALLAGQFDLNLGTIRDIAASARSDAGGTLSERLWDLCRVSVRPRLDLLAQRLDVKATWRDLVLPVDDTESLRQIAAQVAARGKVYGEWGFGQRMNRGLGITVLFAGDSGTGKTMAAEVIANELRLNLYRIDLSAVVSESIGETEKNLRRLFDAADDGGAILFFDEADALFGRRSEVKDSHDRYANVEINYLLQRMESYRGLAILATNMKSALDRAFLRRLRFVVNFSFPGVAERKRLWSLVFPSDTPVAALDYERLARLNLTGGTIHNAALHAAFLAVGAGGMVTMPLVLGAARAELLKLDRPINEADFQWSTGAEAVA